MRIAAVVLLMALSQLSHAQSASWSLKATGGPARAFGAMAYDADRGVVVLYGGVPNVGANNTLFGDTWEWDGSTWRLVATAGPSPRTAASMCYDSVRRRIVLFGGADFFRSYQDTWTWDGTTWQQVATTGPSPRSAPSAMCFDSARGVAVLYGGSGGSDNYIGDTWEWNGSTWSNRNSSAPGNRFETAIVYDSVRNETLLFGGSDWGAYLGGTWTWSGTQWTQRQAPEPPGRWSSVMAFDSARGRAVLFGGYNGGARNDTWEWTGTGWTMMVGPNPPRRFRHMMAFDSRRNVTVMFGGGEDWPNPALGDTWEYGPPCVPPAVASDPVSTSTCTGVPVSLVAAFSGTSPRVQWRRDGVPIAGATNLTLTIANPVAADAGAYVCVATNDCGSVTTTAATLDVTPLLSIETQPASQSVGVDSTVSFLVQLRAFDGCVTPATYQWQRRNPLVTDADAPDAWLDLQEGSQFINVRTAGLIIAKPLPGIATGFRCRIGDGCGCRPVSGFIYSEAVNFNIACPSDFNADGGVDFGDIEAFFMRWEDGC